MRFLADAGVSPKTIEFLKQFGHEATHVRSLGLQRAPDAELVQRARTDDSIIITFDLDFGDILALGSPPLSTTPRWSPQTRGSTPRSVLAERRDVARRGRRRMRGGDRMCHGPRLLHGAVSLRDR